MHELPITESILEISLRHANLAGAKKITQIYLVIGQLSSIIDESVQFYWDIIAKDTIAQGAQLSFTRIQSEFRCQSCQAVFHPDDETYQCPACGSSQVEITAGKEFYIEAIEVEQKDQHAEPS